MTAEPPPQNIYDDPAFFAGYATLERFGAGWERAAELGDLLGLLPEVAERRVLDLGCGAGQLAHHLATRGAAEVVGVDLSERMLALARTQWSHAASPSMQRWRQASTMSSAKSASTITLLTGPSSAAPSRRSR